MVSQVVNAGTYAASAALVGLVAGTCRVSSRQVAIGVSAVTWPVFSRATVAQAYAEDPEPVPSR